MFLPIQLFQKIFGKLPSLKFRKTLKAFVSLTVLSQSLFSYGNPLQTQNSIVSNSQTSLESENPLANSLKDANTQRKALEIFKFSKNLESNQLKDIPIENPFRLNQRQVKVGKQIFLPLEENQKIPRFSASTIIVQSQENVLSFIGMSGMNSEGKNGREVARDEIQMPSRILGVTSFDQHSEFMIVVTETGISAFSTSMIKEALFDPQQPMIDFPLLSIEQMTDIQKEQWNHLVQSLANKEAQLKLGFVTSGTHPDWISNLQNALFKPDVINDEVRLKSFYLGIETQNNKETLVFIPEQTIYTSLLQGATFFRLLDGIRNQNELFNKPESAKLINSIAKKYDDLYSKVNNAELSLTGELLFQNFNNEQRNALDQNLVNWKAKIDQTPNERNIITSTELKKFRNKIITQLPELDENVELENNWNKFVQQIYSTSSNDSVSQIVSLNNNANKNTKEKLSDLFKKIMPGPKARTWLYRTIVPGLYMGYPYFYQYFGGAEIPLLTWVFHHVYPTALQDASIRFSQFGSLFVSIAIAPLLPILSRSMGWSLKKIAEQVNNKDSLFAQKIRDTSNYWNEASDLQRIGKVFLKLSALESYPILHFITKYGFGQNTFIDALQKDLNPFSLYKNPTNNKTEFVGFNIPFVKNLKVGTIYQYNKDERLSQQDRIQAQIKNREKLAMKLATLIVAENEDLTPAEIVLSLQSQKLIERLANDNERSQLELLNFELLESLQSYSAEEINQALLKSDMFERFIPEALHIAQRIKANKNESDQVERKLRRFQYQATVREKLISLFNYGYETYHQYTNIKPIEINQQAMVHSYDELWTDHVLSSVIMVAYPTSMFADINHPDLLYSQKDFPYLSNSASWSLGNNLIGHFILTVPQNLESRIPNDFTSEDESQAKFKNFYSVAYKAGTKVESYSKSFFEEWKMLLNFRKNDFGGYFLLRCKNILKLLNLLLTTKVGMTLLTYPSWSLEKTLATVLENEITNTAMYRHQWAWIYLGRQLTDLRLAKNKDMLDQSIADLGAALDQTNIDYDKINQLSLKIENLYLAHDKKTLQALNQTIDLKKLNSQKELHQEAHDQANTNSTTPKGFTPGTLGLMYKLRDLKNQLSLMLRSSSDNRLQLSKAGQILSDSELQTEIASLRFEIESLESKIIDLTQQKNIDPSIISENAKGLVQLLQTTPPISTNTKNNYADLKTLIFGAIGTSIIGTVAIGDSLNLGDHGTYFDLAYSATKSIVAILLLAKATSKQTWDSIFEMAQKGLLLAHLNLKKPEATKIEDVMKTDKNKEVNIMNQNAQLKCNHLFFAI